MFYAEAHLLANVVDKSNAQFFSAVSADYYGRVDMLSSRISQLSCKDNLSASYVNAVVNTFAEDSISAKIPYDISYHQISASNVDEMTNVFAYASKHSSTMYNIMANPVSITALSSGGMKLGNRYYKSQNLVKAMMKASKNVTCIATSGAHSSRVIYSQNDWSKIGDFITLYDAKSKDSFVFGEHSFFYIADSALPCNSTVKLRDLKFVSDIIMSHALRIGEN